MRRWIGLFCTLFLLVGLSGPAQSQATARGVLEQDFQLYLRWFEGRFDNDRQVFFERDLGVPEDNRHERIHSIFRRVDLPAFGPHVFYVEQYLEGDPARIYRQRLYVMSIDEAENAIRLTIHIPTNPEPLRGAHLDVSKLGGLTPAQTTTYPGCDVLWRRQENQFVGAVPGGSCRVTSSRSGRTLVISDDLVLTEDAIWIHDRAVDDQGEYVYGNRAGVPHQLRRARGFLCWTAVLRGAEHGDSGAGAEGDDWFFQREQWVHDQGGDLLIITDETPARQVMLRLRRVEWPYGTNRPSLTLYVHAAGESRALSYAWGEYDAERLGINLRWLQASCTYAPDRPFG
jgi:CpeT/CpcT family (DUF1001)